MTADVGREIVLGADQIQRRPSIAQPRTRAARDTTRTVTLPVPALRARVAAAVRGAPNLPRSRGGHEVGAVRYIKQQSDSRQHAPLSPNPPPTRTQTLVLPTLSTETPPIDDDDISLVLPLV